MLYIKFYEMNSLIIKDKIIKYSQIPYAGIPFKLFLRFDKKVDGAVTFFIKNYGKTKFMVAMSKKAQYLGLERLFNMGPKAFFYFFMFYLIRDTILYILIPIWVAKIATN